MRATQIVALVLFIVAAVICGAGVLGLIKGSLDLLAVGLIAAGLAFHVL